ncbi:hypothetical protein DDB_G0274999 [Dictyostelium discoideum AX4]|uniref:Uncharacterized protein n=1 Tax=Dictyostelium discoideum TaxID=44689 RepID=Q554N0_DICDI|nr:hypothetical protein DDB_G0274999 [Dictyostelium discoideum AX4]EAL70392.1 hypothetical protein DDB_G0274999 [Dictyostelium discoideum AX4]|eukprot:XP_644293.1 hypothetical protein DDB_G0274999 [Dictyostelium discoideum AX4]
MPNFFCIYREFGIYSFKKIYNHHHHPHTTHTPPPIYIQETLSYLYIENSNDIYPNLTLKKKKIIQSNQFLFLKIKKQLQKNIIKTIEIYNNNNNNFC